MRAHGTRPLPVISACDGTRWLGRQQRQRSVDRSPIMGYETQGRKGKTMSEKHLVFQGLMDRAYDRWDRGTSRESWLAVLEDDEVTAVHFGNMNYQVENGGWPQWVCNRYASHKVLNFIRNRMSCDLEQTPDVVSAAQLLEEAAHHIEKLIEFYACPHSDGCDHSEDEDEYEFACLSEFDDHYYDINDGLMQAVENYLAARQAQVASA